VECCAVLCAVLGATSKYLSTFIASPLPFTHPSGNHSVFDADQCADLQNGIL